MNIEDDRMMDLEPKDNPGLSLAEQFPDEFEMADICPECSADISSGHYMICSHFQQ